MQLSELVTEVERVVDDSSFTSTIIKALINEAVLVIATGVVIPDTSELTSPLPGLFTSATVATVAGTSASLPADYNRDVMFVLNASKGIIKIKTPFEAFLISHPDQTAGAVYECAVLGSNLYYRDIPAAPETLTVYYHKNPTTLALDADTPSIIPSVLHRKLIVGYVCKEIFNKIEDGIEGEKTNTKYYTQEYQSGIIDLERLIGKDYL